MVEEVVEKYDCPVGIHHGPGHQSVTRCHVKEPHEMHEATYGEFWETARWTGGDIFSGARAYDDPYDMQDEPDVVPHYVSDTPWYKEGVERGDEWVKRYTPKDYRDPRLPNETAG